MRRFTVPVIGCLLVVTVLCAYTKLFVLVRDKVASAVAGSNFQAPKVQSTPISASGKAVTNKDLNNLLIKWRMRTMYEAYKNAGGHDPKWDKAASGFMQVYSCWGVQTSNAARCQLVLDQGKNAVNLGCDDPLVLCCYGAGLFQCGKMSEAKPILEKAMKGFEKSDYPACRKVTPPLMLYRLQRQSSLAPIMSHKPQAQSLFAADTEDSRKLLDQVIKYVVEASSDGSFKGDEERIKVYALYSANLDVWHFRGGELAKALRASKGVDPYFLDVVVGSIEIDEGWADRGGDWASEVSDEAFKKFHAHLKTARKHLTAAWKRHPEYPEAPAEMISVAMATPESDVEAPRVWFDRAVAAQLDYKDAYNRIRTALLPRWGGSPDELYELGVDCLNTKRFDTWVPDQFFSILKTIEAEMGGSKEYWKKPETVKHLQVLFDGYQNTGKKSTHWSKSAQVAAAWYSGRNNDAKRLIKELGKNIDTSVFPQLFSVSYEEAQKSLDGGMAVGEVVQNPKNKHYYYIYKGAIGLSWEDARKMAEDMSHQGLKGHLATLTSKDEEAFINSIPQQKQNNYYWVGAYSDRKSPTSERKWKWANGEKWSYENWANGQADNRRPARYYLVCQPGQPWFSLNGSNELAGFVVEYE